MSMSSGYAALPMRGFIDTWGRGFQKIRDGFEADGIPKPRIENFCGGVRVTIERTNFIKMSHGGSNVVDNVADNVADKLTERQHVIIKIIKDVAEDVAVNTKYLSERLGVNRKTIQRDVITLQEKQLIRWVGSDKTGHWEIIDPTDR